MDHLDAVDVDSFMFMCTVEVVLSKVSEKYDEIEKRLWSVFVGY